MADERIRVEYIEPETMTAETPATPTFYDECNWKTYERILSPGGSGSGATQYIDDVDTGGQQSDAT